MIMDSFKNFEHKFQYRIAGHSGDGDDIEFVKEGTYPKNEKDISVILNQMAMHSQYCLSGGDFLLFERFELISIIDNTMSAITTSIKKIAKEEADDYFVLVLSDANIGQYNISPASIGKALKSDDKVNAYMIFIGSIQDQAEV